MSQPLSKERIVYTGGTFDLFHSGHVKFLSHCKKLAGEDGKVVVALNRDDFIKAFKGRTPVMSFEERAATLRGCRFVDMVISNDSGADSKPTISQVQPDIIAIGDDWAKKDYYAQMQFTQKWLDDRDILLVYIPYTQGISTTELKKRISE